MIQWRRWHWILGTSVVDNRRRGQVAKSQMTMAAMWKRKLLGKRWQVIRARMQDKQEVEDMQCIGIAANDWPTVSAFLRKSRTFGITSARCFATEVRKFPPRDLDWPRMSSAMRLM